MPLVRSIRGEQTDHMMIFTLLWVVAILAVVVALARIVPSDRPRRAPRSHWSDPTTAHDRWERIGS